MIGLSSAFVLLFIAMLILPFASANSAEEGKPTPALLLLQKELVDTLSSELEGLVNEERVGQRQIEDLVEAAEIYFIELEIQQVMEARSSKSAISEKELLKVRLETRSKALAYF